MRYFMHATMAGIGCAFLACSGLAFAAGEGPWAAQADAGSPRNIAGVWWASAYTRELRPVDGAAIPFTAAGRARYVAAQADLKSGKLVDNARHTCLPQGVPRVMTTQYPFLIMQTPGQVSLLFEENRVYRTVRLDVRHADPELWDPSFMGESVGHWQGNTLVVGTTNFKTVMFLDDAGLPHSDKLEVSERLTKTGQGSTLEDLITITDPVMFSKPWTVRLEYVSRPEVEIVTDWVCGEPHRNMAGLKGAAR